MQRLLILYCSVLAVAGCAKQFQPRDYASPEALLEVAEGMYRRGKCRDAALGFQYLTQVLPVRDTFAVRARFLLAECQFNQGAFLEAARQFRRVATGQDGATRRSDISEARQLQGQIRAVVVAGTRVVDDARMDRGVVPGFLQGKRCTEHHT